MTTEEIKQYLWNFLRNKGLPEKSTAAVMGNVYAESGFDPNIIEGGNGIGFGLCQWSYGRRRQLESYGITLSHQFYFLWSELTGEDTDVTGADLQWINPPSSSVTGGTSFNCPLDTFMDGDGTVSFLTTAFCYCWERPAHATNHLALRIEKAEEYLKEYGGTGGGGTVDPPPDPDPSDNGEVLYAIEDSSYNVNKLSEEQIEVLRQFKFNDTCKMKYSFNKRKEVVGYNYLGKRLTFDTLTYIIISVRNDGLIVITTDVNNKCYKYIDPRYIEPTENNEGGEGDV